jgi:glycosylphosphatidylinositol transamidase (GPIT) subunit GPI8
MQIRKMSKQIKLQNLIKIVRIIRILKEEKIKEDLGVKTDIIDTRKEDLMIEKTLEEEEEVDQGHLNQIQQMIEESIIEIAIENVIISLKKTDQMKGKIKEITIEKILVKNQKSIQSLKVRRLMYQ